MSAYHPNNFSNFPDSFRNNKNLNNDILIKAPNEIKDKLSSTNTTVIYIDSRDRNIEKYPEPNDYVIHLDDTYRDIVSLELISCDIPKTEYNINSNNNILHYNNGSTVTVPVGNYSSINDLKTAFNDVVDNPFTMAIDDKTRKITLSCTTETLQLSDTVKERDGTRKVLKANSIGRMLGFKPIDRASAASHESDGVYNLANEDYIVLKFDDVERTDGTSNVFKGAFARISFGDIDFGKVKQTKVSDFGSKCIEVFKPIKPKLDRLRIRFFRQDGNLYDFNGLDHSMSIELSTLFQTQKYMVY